MWNDSIKLFSYKMGKTFKPRKELLKIEMDPDEVDEYNYKSENYDCFFC